MYICTNTQVTGLVLASRHIVDQLTSVHMYKQTNDHRNTHKTSCMYMYIYLVLF